MSEDVSPIKEDKTHISLNKALVSNSYLAIQGILVAVWRSLVSSVWFRFEKPYSRPTLKIHPKHQLWFMHLVGNTRHRVSASLLPFQRRKPSFQLAKVLKVIQENLWQWGSMNQKMRVVEVDASQTWPRSISWELRNPLLTHCHSCRDQTWVSNAKYLSYIRGKDQVKCNLLFTVICSHSGQGTYQPMKTAWSGKQKFVDMTCRSERFSAGKEMLDVSFQETAVAQRV